MTSGQPVIDGRFELIDRLGSGGMGTVWRARDVVLEREVALKEVRPAGTSGDDPARAPMLRERVLREARALARLDHANVVTIHHVVDAPERPYPWLVMELVRGRSLQERLAAGPLPAAEAAVLGSGILAALRAAHAAGILHRDVKPANVLLRPDGSPVLTDFGIAALDDAARVTATGGLVGSPEYMAPERLRSHEGDPASDLWSLGMLLYVAVEGHSPLRRPTLPATIAAVLNARIPPPQRAGPLTPVLTALLVAEPALRPPAAELERMLAQAARPFSTGPVPAPSIPPSTGPVPAMPTGPAVPMPPGRATPIAAMSAPPRTAGRRRPGMAVLVGVAGGTAFVALLVTVLVMVVLPAVRDAGNRLGTGNGALGGTPAAGGSAPDTAGPGTGDRAQPANLLTPAGIRGVIVAFEKATGGTQFTEFTVFAEHAAASAPVRNRPDVYDKFTYREGQATRLGPGGTLSSSDGKVQLRSFNWNAVPALFRRAQRTLKVPKPTSRYIIVEPSWVFAGNQPVMLVYLTDEYGGGYLAASRKGTVLRTVPRS